MKVEIIEIASTTNSTVSMLYIDGRHESFIIEDGYRGAKVPGETRIDGGIYHLKARYHGKFYEEYKRKFNHEFAIEIVGVKNFTDILSHIGNTVKDTRGCTLNNMGFKIDVNTGNYVGIDSTTAYKRFYNSVYLELKAGNLVPFIVIRNEVQDQENYG